MSPAATLQSPLGGLPTAALRALVGDITDTALKDGAGWLKDPRLAKPAVLAFDPGATTGWARLTRSHGYMGGSLTRDGKPFLQTVDDLLTGMFVLGGSTEPRLVVVEDVFLYQPKDADGKARSNPKTLSAMARNVGAIIALATLRGLPVWRVLATSWQSKLLGKIRREQGKKLSVAKARALFGASISSDHQADAALLALYARGGKP